MTFSLRRSLPILVLSSALCGGLAGAAPLNVGLAFDIGGPEDQGFNQAALQGAQRAIKEVGGKLTYVSPDATNEVGSEIPKLARAGNKLVIGVGFANNPAITRSAKYVPWVKFVTVDDLPEGPNTAGLRFREHEGSFLAGYLAGQRSATGVVGFIGGLDVPVIQRFRAGYEAGVKFACPQCQVKTQFVGTTGAGFNDPAGARKIAARMQAQGADILYAAAGGSGLGVIAQVKAQPCLKAANLPSGVKFGSDHFRAVPKSAAYQKACAGNTRPTFFIGVDSNQNRLGDFDKNPATMNHGLTSMLKRVDNAVYTIIKDFAEGRTWRPGDRSFGLSNNGVGLAIDRYNEALLPAAVQDNLKKITALIIDGAVKVPTK